MSYTAAIRAMIVDDEPAARELLAEILSGRADIEIVGTAADPESAIRMIREVRPDVMFLDIHMPDGSGFEIADAAEELGAPAPMIVFVTAYDAHAIAAFEAGALDYVLKPFEEERLLAAVDRAVTQRRLRAANGSAGGLAVSPLEAVRARLPRLHRIPLRVGDRIHLVPVQRVVWLEADGKHVKVHFVDDQNRPAGMATRRTMQSLELQLDPDRFVRVSRSAIVNIDHLRHAEPWSNGEYVLVLRDGARVLTTPTFRKAIQGILRGA